MIIFLLYINFGNTKDTLISLITIPFVGGFLSLWMTGTTFGISARIGFIILFGVCAIDGVILVHAMKDNHIKKLPLKDAIWEGIFAASVLL